MKVSRKSWHYKFFRLVYVQENSNLSRIEYIFWSLIGFVAFVASMLVGIKIFLLVSYAVSIHPELAAPINVEILGLALIFILTYMTIRRTRLYLWLVSFLDRPKAMILPPVTFVD